MKINMIVACCSNNGIGFQNEIPWFIKNDLKYFANKTKGDGKNAIIMGRKTWESIPKKPLPSRKNIVLSHNVEFHKNINNHYKDIVECFDTSQKSLNFCQQNNYEQIWIIGGTEIYKHFYENYIDIIDIILITKIDKEYECDAFFPDISDNFDMIGCKLTVENDLASKQNVQVEYQIFQNKKFM